MENCTVYKIRNSRLEDNGNLKEGNDHDSRIHFCLQGNVRQGEEGKRKRMIKAGRPQGNRDGNGQSL